MTHEQNRHLNRLLERAKYSEWGADEKSPLTIWYEAEAVRRAAPTEANRATEQQARAALYESQKIIRSAE